MIGQRFGRYRVCEKIGQGGMGEVYAARHEHMNRDAVVKVLLPEMSVNRTIVKRFFNEAQSAASIHHPGIVEVFDLGYTDDHRAYIIMERLRGESLKARIRRMGRIPSEQAVILIRQLAGAVGAAHEHDIVHRDLKPDNLFVVPDPEVSGGERIKVLDFGLAKLVTSGGSMATRTGSIFGTPAYMAPEQCMDAAAVDHRADLYAIGCIFYELLTGRPPFGSGGIELLAAHLRDTPISPRQLVPELAPGLDVIVLTLLSKSPDARYPSCQALIAALDATAIVRPSASWTASAPMPHGGQELALGNPAAVSGAGSFTASAGAGELAAAAGPGRRRIAIWAGSTALGLVAAGALVLLIRPDASRESTSPAVISAERMATEVPADTGAIDHKIDQKVDAAADAASFEELEREPAGEAALEEMRAAIAEEDYEALLAAYARISETSRYHRAATALLEQARLDYRGRLLARMEALAKARACNELHAVQATLVSEFPDAEARGAELAASCARRAVPTTSLESPVQTNRRAESRTKTESRKDLRSLVAGLKGAYRRGEHHAVLNECPKVLALGPADLESITVCGLAACNVKNAREAKRYYNMLTAKNVDTQRRAFVVQACLKNTIDVR